jgi:hypothetical protein
MHNYFSIEVESEFRRHEAERTAAADARADQATAEVTTTRQPHLFQQGLANLFALATLRAPVAPQPVTRSHASA